MDKGLSSAEYGVGGSRVRGGVHTHTHAHTLLVVREGEGRPHTLTLLTVRFGCTGVRGMALKRLARATMRVTWRGGRLPRCSVASRSWCMLLKLKAPRQAAKSAWRFSLGPWLGISRRRTSGLRA